MFSIPTVSGIVDESQPQIINSHPGNELKQNHFGKHLPTAKSL